MELVVVIYLPNKDEPKVKSNKPKEYFISTHIPHHRPATRKYSTYQPTAQPTQPNHLPMKVPNPGSSCSSPNSETQNELHAPSCGSDQITGWIEPVRCTEPVADRPSVLCLSDSHRIFLAWPFYPDRYDVAAKPLAGRPHVTKKFLSVSLTVF